MRILMLAPHPFYQERGTPIAVNLLLTALADRGDTVDVVTYSEGENRAYGSGVSIHRIKHKRFLAGIRPGFSLKKLMADIYLYRTAQRLLQKQSYDVIHAIEEAGFLAYVLGRRYHIPYVFDMDSSMPDQIVNKLKILRPLRPLMRWLEDFVIRDAAVVVPMCDALADAAKRSGAARVVVLRDVSLLPEHIVYDAPRGFRAPFGIQGPAILYVGNLESYQGIDLLLEGFSCLATMHREVTLVLVGGRVTDVEHYRARCVALGLADRVWFAGPRPVDDMPHLFHDADILVSPRTQGANTPMKVYSYLDAGTPLVATRLPTHTQVMDDQVAMLVDPDPDALARGMQLLLEQPALGCELAERAKRLARERYSPHAFRLGVASIYDTLQQQSRKSDTTTA